MWYSRCIRAVLGFFICCISLHVFPAGDPVAGKTLYNDARAGLSCSTPGACHGSDPTQNNNNILKGANNASSILNAINGGVGAMGFLAGKFSAAEIGDIATYLGAPNGAPAVSLTPTTLSFGNQQVATSSTAQSVTLKNTGTAALAISGIASSSTEFPETHTCGASLAVAASCTMNVTFKPASVGAKTGTITITDNASGSPHKVTLSGSGTAATAPAITLTPSTGLAFGSQTVGVSSAAQTVTLKNTGSANLSIATIALGGTNAADFAKAGTCANGGTVAPNATCTISITFTPFSVGAKSGNVSIASNAPAATFTLSGTGVSAATPGVGLAPTSLAFGNQTINTTSAAKNISLSNTGNAALTISNITVSSGFAQTNNCAASIAPSGSCTISVTFAPTATGAKTGSVTITDNASGSPHSVGLTGTGVAAATPQVGPLPSTVSFGNQMLNTTSPAQTVTIDNIGSAALAISTIAVTGDFAKSGGTCINGSSVAAGSNCTILLTFKPAVLGARSGTVTVTDNAAGSPRSVSLTGTGVSAPGPTATLLPAKLVFGDQALNTTSAAQVVTLKNTSAATALSINGITIGGANGTDFAKTTTCGASLNAGASCNISLTFKPTVAGLRSAMLSVTSNAAGALNTVLEGTGVSAATPKVGLDAASLAFGNQTLNTTSGVKKVTLSNTGNAALHITSILASGDFVTSNTCGAQLAAGANCVISVTFKPTQLGARTGEITITSDAASSPDVVKLTGTGISGSSPTLTYTPSSLAFSDQTVGTASAAKTVTLKNTGSGPMQLKSIMVSGTHPDDFSLTENCGTTLASGASCTVSVTFKPTAIGIRGACVKVLSDAGDGEDSVALSGRGIPAASGTPILSISQIKLEFSPTKQGQVSAALEITLKNVGTADLKIGQSRVVKGDSFTKAEDACSGKTLAPNQSCTIKVCFEPKVAGDHEDELEVDNDSDGSKQKVTLSGAALPADTGGGSGSPTTQSGGGGGGCAFNAKGDFDPLLPALLLIATIVLLGRRRWN